MKTYMLTAFSPKGEVLLNEAFDAATDLDAQTQGEQMLSEKDLLDKTYRCSSPLGKLVLFNS